MKNEKTCKSLIEFGRSLLVTPTQSHEGVLEQKTHKNTLTDDETRDSRYTRLIFLSDEGL